MSRNRDFPRGIRTGFPAILFALSLTAPCLADPATELKMRQAAIENLTHPFTSVKAEAWGYVFSIQFWNDPELRKIGLFALQSKHERKGYDPLTRTLSALAWSKLQGLPWWDDAEVRAHVERAAKDATSPGYTYAREMLRENSCKDGFGLLGSNPASPTKP